MSREDYKPGCADLAMSVETLLAERDQLRADLAVCVEALELIANDEEWDPQYDGESTLRVWPNEKYGDALYREQIAQEALAKVKL